MRSLTIFSLISVHYHTILIYTLIHKWMIIHSYINMHSW